MYIFINKGLGMSTGKAAAQASHAAVEAFRGSDPNLEFAWLLGGHYKKLVMEADDSDELANIGGYLEDRGFTPVWIYDEGLTEFDGRMRHTAIGVPIVDKDDPNVAATFSTFRLYKDKPPMPGHIRAADVRASTIQDSAVPTNNLLHTDKPAPPTSPCLVTAATAAELTAHARADLEQIRAIRDERSGRRRIADGLSKLRSWG